MPGRPSEHGRHEPEWVSERDYYEAENLPRALHCAHSVVDAVQARLIDPLLRHDEVGLAYEVLCDAPGGDSRKAFKVVTETQDRYRRPELWESDSRTGNAARIACGLATAAEVAHRDGRYRQAVINCLSAFSLLADAAGGQKELLKLVASSKPHPLAEAAVAVNGCWTAALRRARYLPETKQWFRAQAPDILPPFLASGVRYPRTHASATQDLFRQAELEIPDHLDELRTISDETRGSSLRSWTTAPLVSMEYERIVGSIELARREAKQAFERLQAFGLKRHLERMDEFGYLSF